ncbi:hypothetical protein [Leptodesmis sichuanensis]|uniref:hypothetical protein n=1 Tax=Leptodesmis sichuanensis TaxID=2906798 RepID=UPI001F3B22AE|nr:hypothetical protein [Leptodesmis sichuanensis]UIE38184.1 hypothetical protein KIK02_00525 [Leptodesmis sichuanensis A121]
MVGDELECTGNHPVIPKPDAANSLNPRSLAEPRMKLRLNVHALFGKLTGAIAPFAHSHPGHPGIAISSPRLALAPPLD